MDPITRRLVVHENGNSMLEPFRRVTDSSMPTNPDEFVGHPPFKATSYQVRLYCCFPKIDSHII